MSEIGRICSRRSRDRPELRAIYRPKDVKGGVLDKESVGELHPRSCGWLENDFETLVGDTDMEYRLYRNHAYAFANSNACPGLS